MSKDNQAPPSAPAPHTVNVLDVHRSPESGPSRWLENIASVTWAGVVVAGISSLNAPIGASILLVAVCASTLPLAFELRDTKRQLSALTLAVRSSQPGDGQLCVQADRGQFVAFIQRRRARRLNTALEPCSQTSKGRHHQRSCRLPSATSMRVVSAVKKATIATTAYTQKASLNLAR